ncbi:UNVERIFIED_CONTAM: hypothetical protein PYX00_007194 [Menopon gallinae]|uniref:Uncharacterized protein n=1 Tax=Menopon gallinae TaxID=328185 RepID=A0AAW2HIK4_9NEOP
MVYDLLLEIVRGLGPRRLAEEILQQPEAGFRIVSPRALREDHVPGRGKQSGSCPWIADPTPNGPVRMVETVLLLAATECLDESKKLIVHYPHFDGLGGVRQRPF